MSLYLYQYLIALKCALREAYKVTSDSVEVTVAVIVDIEVIVTGAWQDVVAEDVEAEV
jgi:hypothetical protein